MAAWTPERRARQAELVRQLKPWEKSTGPRTAKGKAKASRNSRKHGLRSETAREIAKPSKTAPKAQTVGARLTHAQFRELLRISVLSE